MSPQYIELAPVHPTIRKVEANIFTKRLVADCLKHDCQETVRPGQVKHDICCQYGADVEVAERDRILAAADAIKAVMRPDAANATWFVIDSEDEDEDEDAWDNDASEEEITEIDGEPTHVEGAVESPEFVRTAVFGDTCVFMHHDQRGCAIHRVAIEKNWVLKDIKPHVCRMFPITYDDDAIMIADDYTDYSCAFDANAPSLYRVQREVIRDVFGDELVAALDAAEADVLRQQPLRLPVVRASL